MVEEKEKIYYEDTERTPEQVAASEARKARLHAEKVASEEAKRRRARRRVIDVEATARKLLREGKVTTAWYQRQTKDTMLRMVKVACIANMMDAVSLTGHDMMWHTLEYRY